MLKRYCLFLFFLFLSPTGFAQTNQEDRPLDPGRVVEREIAGGQTHAYRITLGAGQMMRADITPQAVNVGLDLTAPDGKQMATVNSASFAGPESLSWEAEAAGVYRLRVRAIGAAFNGSYQARLEIKIATAQDNRRIEIERLLAEADKLSSQGAAMARQTIERAQQALALCREAGNQPGEAFALFLIGDGWEGQGRNQEAAENYEQSL